MIPAEAVEAAYDALPLDSSVFGLDRVRIMLTAAAPYMHAEALEDAADAWGPTATATWLRARAENLRARL